MAQIAIGSKSVHQSGGAILVYDDGDISIHVHDKETFEAIAAPGEDVSGPERNIIQKAVISGGVRVIRMLNVRVSQIRYPKN